LKSPTATTIRWPSWSLPAEERTKRRGIDGGERRCVRSPGILQLL